MIATDPAAVLDQLDDPTALRSCVLIIHPNPEALLIAVHDLAISRGWVEIAIGRDLSAALLNIPVNHRPGRARRWGQEQLAILAPGPVVLTGIDLLFEPSLELDSLGLLRQLSRLTPIVAAWPGSFNKRRLAYGTPEHAHYRTWSDLGTQVTPLQL